MGAQRLGRRRLRRRILDAHTRPCGIDSAHERAHVKLAIQCKPNWLYKPRNAWPVHGMRSNLALFGQFCATSASSGANSKECRSTGARVGFVLASKVFASLL